MRKKDGAEIFTIRKQRWVETWMNQPHPVMLVIGTFAGEDERAVGKEKVEFADVRWMEISSVLQRESANGTKAVRQIEFAGERLDMSSVRLLGIVRVCGCGNGSPHPRSAAVCFV